MLGGIGVPLFWDKSTETVPDELSPLASGVCVPSALVVPIDSVAAAAMHALLDFDCGSQLGHLFLLTVVP
eukprot:14446741-Ditylum_brightwellii.AAC.1